MSPLRFLMLTTFYPPYNFGGDGIGIQRLSRALVRRGHDVTVVHDRDTFTLLGGLLPPGAAAHDDDEGVKVRRLGSALPRLSTALTQQLGRPVLLGRAIRALVADGGYDVVNFHNVSMLGGPGLLSYGGGAVTLYMAHEHWLVCPTHVLWRHQRERCTGRQCVRCSLAYRRPPQPWRATGYLERQARHVDAFIAMSEFSRDKHREFGFGREMEVLPYFLPDPDSAAVPTAAGAAPHPRPYFLFVGRLERIKGLQDVIPALARFPAADLVVAGDGTFAPELRAMAAGLPNVHFLGRLEPEALRTYYQHAVALVVPSECYETFGIVLIEAFRQATPVIARRLGPFPEIISQSGGGELFSSDEELVAAMHRLMTEPGHRARCAASGYRAYVDRWSERAVLPRYLGIVRRAAARRGHARVLAALPEESVA